jgi:kynureninase
VVSRDAAEELDRIDPLRDFPARFVAPPDPGRIYLNGNSLGPLPHATAARLADAVLHEWGHQQVDGWDHWLGLSERVGNLIGQTALGAAAGQIVVADSTTVQLYKLASAALDARPDGTAIVVDRGEFPSDRYVLEGLADARGLRLIYLDSHPVHGPQPHAVARVTAAGNVALVCLSLVSYRSGALADLAGVTRAARDAGALTLWDLSHAVGAVDILLDDAQVDLAVGCTYKHLNGGPGSPGFAFVRRDVQTALRQPIQGWFGQEDMFAMGPAYIPRADVGRFQTGTPPILGLVAVESSVRLLAEAGIDRARRRAEVLTRLVVDLFDAWLAPRGFALASPREPHQRGGHIALRHPDAENICRRLQDDHGVVTDFRSPDILRIGPALLSTRFVEIWDAMDRLRRLADETGGGL